MGHLEEVPPVAGVSRRWWDWSRRHLLLPAWQDDYRDI